MKDPCERLFYPPPIEVQIISPFLHLYLQPHYNIYIYNLILRQRQFFLAEIKATIGAFPPYFKISSYHFHPARGKLLKKIIFFLIHHKVSCLTEV